MADDEGKPAAAARFVAKAIEEHVRRARAARIAPPAEVLFWAEHFQIVARSGQDRPSLADLVAGADDASVAPLLHPLPEVARLLGGMSERTVRRLMSSGVLPAVEVGGRKLVAHEDLVAYVERLRAGSTTSEGAS